MYSIDSNQRGVPTGKVRYRFDLRLLERRYRKTVICNRSDVRTLYREWEKEIVAALDGDSHLFFEKIDDYLRFVKNHKSKSAYRMERLAVNSFRKYFQDMELSDFRRYMIDDYVANQRSRGLSDASINRYLAVLSTFFNWCIDREYYSRANPVQRKKLKLNNEREVLLSPTQVRELLDKAEGDMRTAVFIALMTGLRAGEIMSLRWVDIDFDQSRIFLSAQVTKSSRYRIVPIPDPLKSYLIRLRTTQEEHVITRWQTYSGLRISFKKLRTQLSFGVLPNGLYLHFHDLRHVFAQSLLDTGVPLDDIKVLLGHSSVTITEKRYAQFGRQDVQNKVNRLTEYFGLDKMDDSVRTDNIH